MLSSQVREILTGVEAVIVDEIHAVAQTKRGSHLALTLERLDDHVRATPRRATEPRDPADRPLGHAAAAGADRPVPGRPEAQVRDRRRRAAEGARPRDRRPGRGHVRPGRARLPERGRPAADRNRALRPRPLDLAGDLPEAAGAGPGTHLDDHLRQQPPRRRAPGQAPERAGQRRRRAGAAGDRARGATTRPAERSEEAPARTRDALRRDRPRPPRLALPRGADRGRGAAQVRAAALPGRHQLAGAGDRHGRRRPGDPGRVAEVGDPRPAADRPRRPRARRGLERPDLPQIPRRPARVRGGRQADARSARSRRR